MLCSAAGCGRSEDLSNAIDGGVGRTITESVLGAPQQIAWINLLTAEAGNDVRVPLPRSICWLGANVLVADGATQRVEVFDADGRYVRGFGREGSGPGEFLSLGVVRCSEAGGSVLVVDPGSMRVQFFDSAGIYRGTAATPPTPQGVPSLGEFAVHDDGRWFDSWLGASLGPYLADDEWAGVKIVREWSASGDRIREFGRPFTFRDPVLRRVFNKVNFVLHRDTLWTLVQGRAVVRSFELATGSEESRIFLPVYHRGEEPWIEVKGNGPGFRHNRAVYQPNVNGLAFVYDSLFATIRYRNWKTVKIERRKGEGFTDYWPESSVEIFDRKGKVLMEFAVPGRVSAIASDHRNGIAILSEDLETGVISPLVARIPRPESPPTPGAGGAGAGE